jgi:hypothetical protein
MRLRKWLGQHGYPLEMRAARAFRDAGWGEQGFPRTRPGASWEVDQSVYYKAASDKWREIDVVASIRAAYPGTTPWRAFEFVVLLECKSSEAKPWVVFTTEYSAGPSLFRYASQAANSIGAAFLNSIDSPFSDEYELLTVQKRTGYALVRAFENDNQDIAYNTTLSIIDATTHWSQFSSNRHTARCRVLWPLIVVSAPLFECYLDDSNREQLAARESMTLHLTSRSRDRPYDVVEIVRESALPAHIAKLSELHSMLWEGRQAEIESAFSAHFSDTAKEE